MFTTNVHNILCILQSIPFLSFCFKLKFIYASYFELSSCTTIYAFRLVAVIVLIYVLLYILNIFLFLLYIVFDNHVP